MLQNAASALCTSLGQMSTNVSQLMICILSGVCCLLPLAILPESNIERSLLRTSLPAQLHRDSAIAVLTLIVPLLLDIITDILTSLFSKAKDTEVRKTSKQALLNNMEHLVFLCGTAILPITAFISENNKSWAYIYISCRQCQLVLTGGAITISLCRHNQEYWPIRVTYFVLVLLLIASTIGAFTNNYLTMDPPSYAIQTLQSTSYYIFLGAAATYTFCSVRWLRMTIPKLIHQWNLFFKKSAKDKLKDRGNHADSCTECFVFPVVYVVTSVSICPPLFFLTNVYTSSIYYDVKALFFHNLAFFVYLLLITYGSTRMMKHEIVKGLYALIESKKMYVRYISHELRTPLNSACLGLKLVSDDLEGSVETKDADRFEILSDVKAACRTAVQILDDLLCFDKLESGILEIHKHEVLVMPFMTDCVSMFASQAKEAGVTMSLVTPQRDLHGESLTLIQEGDTVFMDKFKMDQVLRNLISNALKFTPRGGSVSVSASFNPKNTALTSIITNSKIIGSDLPPSPGVMFSNWIQRCFLKSKRLELNSTFADNHDIEEAKFDCSSNDDVFHGKLVIVVTDTGAGISDKNQRRLFNEIVQFNPEVLQAGGGSGLGLWITNSLVKMHNGAVRVQSAGEGMGCSFTAEIEMKRRGSLARLSVQRRLSDVSFRSTQSIEIEGIEVSQRVDASDVKHMGTLSSKKRDNKSNTLPSTATMSATASDEDVSNDLIPPKSTAFRSFCTNDNQTKSAYYDILVVDDSSLNRKMLCRVLRTSGHHCDEADDGLSAVEKVKMKMKREKRKRSENGNSERRMYDVILMDFVMPNMDGPTATKAIRDLGYSGYIFGVTGNALGSDINHFCRHGADRVLAKPFEYKIFELYMKSAEQIT